MKSQLMFAHLIPHFHAGGGGLILIFLALCLAIALIFMGASGSKDK